MRILHVTDCYLPQLGGIEMHVHDLATCQRWRNDAQVVHDGSASVDDDPPGCPASARRATGRVHA